MQGKKIFILNQRKIYFQVEFFNFIDLDEENGLITKKSLDKNKLKSEISWYKLIPKKIKLMTPKIILINPKRT